MKIDLSFEIETKLIGFIYIELYRQKIYYPVMKLGTPKVVIPLESPLSIKIPALETLDTNIITLEKIKNAAPNSE